MKDNSKINIVNKFSINLLNVRNKQKVWTPMDATKSISLSLFLSVRSHSCSPGDPNAEWMANIANWIVIRIEYLRWYCVTCVCFLFRSLPCTYLNLWPVISLATWVCLSFRSTCCVCLCMVLCVHSFQSEKTLSWIGHSRRHRHTGIATHSSAHLNLIVCLSLLNLTRTISSPFILRIHSVFVYLFVWVFSLYICQITKFSQLTLLTESFHSF